MNSQLAKDSKKGNKMWGSRFDGKTSSLMEAINESISFDQVLYKQDIAGSIAHVKMLNKIGVVTKDELDTIIHGLIQIEEEIEGGKFEFKTELEDIHMNIESRLTEIIGDVAGKLHTARSRNDQVALDFRMFVRDDAITVHNLLIKLEDALVKLSKENIDAIMPGFTHLQIAQPVLFSHHMLAYFEMFKRDMRRIKDFLSRIDECPLGACAMAGTSFETDRDFVAKELGFSKPTNNSMDSVSDRDFALEYLFILSVISTHLSRLAEEIVIWMSKGFNFVKLSDSFTSGSSIMPQKRNPDAAELVRGKSGRIFGSLFSLLTTLKGLSLTYSKDMQEDKEPVFDAAQSIQICIQAMAGMLVDMKINKENMLKMAKKDFSTATDIADWLVKNLGIPFRQSHHISGSIVKMAEDKGVDLDELSLEEMQTAEPRIDETMLEVLSVESSVNSRTSYGGTARVRVSEQVKKAEEFIKSSL